MTFLKRTLTILLAAGSLCAAMALTPTAAMAYSYTMLDYNNALDQLGLFEAEESRWEAEAYNTEQNAMLWDNMYQMWENQCGEDPGCVPRWEAEREITREMYGIELEGIYSNLEGARQQVSFWSWQLQIIRNELNL